MEPYKAGDISPVLKEEKLGEKEDNGPTWRKCM